MPVAPDQARVRSLDEAAAFVGRVGIALLYPNPDLVLPSLWEAVAGRRPVEWAARDDQGRFLAFTPEFDRVWRWKDELPARKLACAGQHAARPVCLFAPELAGALYALTARAGRPEDFRELELTPLQREVAEAVLELGSSARPEIRRLLATDDKKGVDRAVEALQRHLVLTNAGVDDREPGWPAVKVEIFARHWRERLERLPSPEEARQKLARAVLEAAGEVSDADVAAALGWRRRQASAALAALGDVSVATAREEDGIRLWSPAAAARCEADGRTRENA